MVANRVKAAREAKGMTQAELAEQLGITQAAFSYIENGDKSPSLPVAKRMAQILGTSIDHLVGMDDDH